jgi:hypothetical protein
LAAEFVGFASLYGTHECYVNLPNLSGDFDFPFGNTHFIIYYKPISLDGVVSFGQKDFRIEFPIYGWWVWCSDKFSVCHAPLPL